MKKIFNILFIGIVITAIGGCAHNKEPSVEVDRDNVSIMSDLSVGMTKPEVIAIMGKPVRVSASGDMEYLIYQLHGKWIPFTPPQVNYKDYFVRLIGGKVESYGVVGDFDPTKPAGIDIRINK